MIKLLSVQLITATLLFSAQVTGAVPSRQRNLKTSKDDASSKSTKSSKSGYGDSMATSRTVMATPSPLPMAMTMTTMMSDTEKATKSGKKEIEPVAMKMTTMAPTVPAPTSRPTFALYPTATTFQPTSYPTLTPTKDFSSNYSNKKSGKKDSYDYDLGGYYGKKSSGKKETDGSMGTAMATVTLKPTIAFKPTKKPTTSSPVMGKKDAYDSGSDVAGYGKKSSGKKSVDAAMTTSRPTTTKKNLPLPNPPTTKPTDKQPVMGKKGSYDDSSDGYGKKSGKKSYDSTSSPVLAVMMTAKPTKSPIYFKPSSSQPTLAPQLHLAPEYTPNTPIAPIGPAFLPSSPVFSIQEELPPTTNAPASSEPTLRPSVISTTQVRTRTTILADGSEVTQCDEDTLPSAATSSNEFQRISWSFGACLDPDSNDATHDRIANSVIATLQELTVSNLLSCLFDDELPWNVAGVEFPSQGATCSDPIANDAENCPEGLYAECSHTFVLQVLRIVGSNRNGGGARRRSLTVLGTLTDVDTMSNVHTLIQEVLSIAVDSISGISLFWKGFTNHPEATTTTLPSPADEIVDDEDAISALQAGDQPTTTMTDGGMSRSSVGVISAVAAICAILAILAIVLVAMHRRDSGRRNGKHHDNAEDDNDDQDTLNNTALTPNDIEGMDISNYDDISSTASQRSSYEEPPSLPSEDHEVTSQENDGIELVDNETSSIDGVCQPHVHMGEIDTIPEEKDSSVLEESDHEIASSPPRVNRTSIDDDLKESMQDLGPSSPPTTQHSLAYKHADTVAL
mmetsp:Transcript_16935/g.39029  ORF Transcript_16935/g.39029 Transcript_16935/m.39029 type:complete len:791 (-) Transcript_16935:113-2485(-)